MIFVCWLLILQASAQIWHSPILPIKIYTPRKQGLYVLFTTGNVQFYQKNNGAWRAVQQAYKKVNGRWEEIEFTLIGDPNAKYIKRN